MPISSAASFHQAESFPVILLSSLLCEGRTVHDPCDSFRDYTERHGRFDFVEKPCELHRDARLFYATPDEVH